MSLRKLLIAGLVAMAITGCSQNTAMTDTAAMNKVEAELSSAMAEKPSISSSRSVKVTAKVTAIDHETRVVTLVGNDGRPATFTVGEEARNLDQVAVGDLVTADYLENITIQVIAAENVDPSQAVLATAGRSEEGSLPAMEAIETQVDVYTIEEINLEDNTFKLKNVDGLVAEFNAKNPANLTKVAVGDVVVRSLTHAVAISVEKSVAE